MRPIALFATLRTVFAAGLILAVVGVFVPEVRAAGRVIIYNFDGKSSVVRNHKTIPVDLDMSLKEGDLLRTEKDGFADMTLNGIVGVRLLESGDCLVVNSSEGGMILKTTGGNFLVNMKALSVGSSFRLATPSATVVVSDTLPGTQFLVRSQKDSKGEPFTTVISNKNTIYVYIERASVTVSILEGRALEIPMGNVIPAIRLATEEELTAANLALSVYVAE